MTLIALKCSQVWQLGCLLLCFGANILKFGYWISDVGLLVSYFGLFISKFGVSGLGLQPLSVRVAHFTVFVNGEFHIFR